MPLVPFSKLMAAAEAGGYAVGYFESWNLESLLAVADAAVAARSPVIVGFSGIYLPHPDRVVRDPLAAYAAMGRAVCEKLPVPASLLFNESPHLDWVLAAVDSGFNLVMFSDESLALPEQTARVKEACHHAQARGVAVEAELAALPGVGGAVTEQPAELQFTDPSAARAFVAETGVDALAVNIGQVHLHGRQKVRLNLAQLDRLRETVDVPLVLHGASSVADADLVGAIQHGIRKINVGSVLKQTYLEGLRSAVGTVSDRDLTTGNPYELIGSGFERDVLVGGRVAMQHKVEELMRLFGSAGRAES